MNECYKLLCTPLQVAPSTSSRKPLLHPQMKLPLVFVHIWEQLCVPLLHSSISERMEMKSLISKYKYIIIHNVYLCISVQSMHECTSIIMYQRLYV